MPSSIHNKLLKKKPDLKWPKDLYHDSEVLDDSLFDLEMNQDITSSESESSEAYEEIFTHNRRSAIYR